VTEVSFQFLACHGVLPFQWQVFYLCRVHCQMPWNSLSHLIHTKTTSFHLHHHHSFVMISDTLLLEKAQDTHFIANHNQNLFSLVFHQFFMETKASQTPVKQRQVLLIPCVYLAWNVNSFEQYLLLFWDNTSLRHHRFIILSSYICVSLLFFSCSCRHCIPVVNALHVTSSLKMWLKLYIHFVNVVVSCLMFE